MLGGNDEVTIGKLLNDDVHGILFHPSIDAELNLC